MSVEKPAELDLKLLRKFARIDKKKAILQAALDRTKAELSPISDIVVNHMIDCGIQNIKVSGRTIYTTDEVYVKRDGTMAEANICLKKAGMETFINQGYNHQTLSAFVREKVKNNEPLPKEFGKILTANHVNKVKSIKA